MKLKTLGLPVIAAALVAATALAFPFAADAKPSGNSFSSFGPLGPYTYGDRTACNARIYIRNFPSIIEFRIEAFNPQNGQSGTYGPRGASNANGWGELYFFIFYAGMPELCTELDCDTMIVQVSPQGEAGLPNTSKFYCN